MSQEQAFISVIIPTKNRVPLLTAAIESLQAQSYAEWEAVVVDDASSKDNVALMSSLLSRDPRVRFRARQSALPGANVCRNEGLEAAKGSLIVFLDSDDLLAPHCLQRREAVMARNHDLDFAVFPGELFRASTGDLKIPFCRQSGTADLDRFLYFDCPWHTTGPIWRRAALQRLGGFDPTLKSWQDIDLHIRAVAAGLRYLKFEVSDHYVRHHVDIDRISYQQFRSLDHLRSASKWLGSIRTELVSRSLLTWSRRRALAGLHLLLAENAYRNGAIRDAYAIWSQALHNCVATHFLLIVGFMLLNFQLPALQNSRYAGGALSRIKGWLRLREQPRALRDHEL